MEGENLILYPKNKNEDDFRIFSVRIREDLLEQINGIADCSGYSRNELVNRFLEYALDRCVVPGQAALVNSAAEVE